jgi:purine-binding chemotaxis protein CheW
VKNSRQLVVFTLDEQRYALYLSAVKKVVRVVEITPLPKAPEIVPGVVNVYGRVIPVMNIRKRFRLPEREITLSDRLLIAQTRIRATALIVDDVSGVFECPEQEIIAAGKILPGIEYIEGVVKLKDGMLFIHDLDRFLSLEEENMLDNALEGNEEKRNDR